MYVEAGGWGGRGGLVGVSASTSFWSSKANARTICTL